ncbi:MAG: bifunctional phosphopantothenoylcysteine decarboxylase/phosphopantothenate--cysteine ligase CoaBC [Anaerolineales bacterium]|nr:bifunctional phosphopantothenoylcysteine decarboxylase/phosphopantothenate--cysteine ligase CoaBC [Anaerolineales bacterium]
MSILSDKHILLGVTGSIAAYKAVDLASKLTQAGSQVDVLLTAAAEKFVSALTFQSVTGRKTFTDADLWGGNAHVLHVGLGHSADLMVIAPCTANTLAKLAHGQANDLVSITALAAQCPILVAPAMDVGMYTSVPTQANIRILQERGIAFAGPTEGRMASGLTGLGRMLEPGEVLGASRQVLGRRGPLVGKKVVVTAGGTREPIDPVRFIANHSSGKQGYALAQAAIDAGGQVVLIHTQTGLIPPVGVQQIPVDTVGEMLEAVLAEAAGADVLVMAAAPADFRPKQAAVNKLKKRDGLPQIELEYAPDILETISNMEENRPVVVVGFAAESHSLIQNAAEKLKAKKLDMIAGNDVLAPDAGFAVETNRITLLFADGRQEPLPLMSKTEAAEEIMKRVAALLETTLA